MVRDITMMMMMMTLWDNDWCSMKMALKGAQRNECRRNDGTTYHSLGQTDVVGWWWRGGLVWTTGISEDGQLLGTFDTALAETTELDPVGTHWLVGTDDKVVTFAWIGRKKTMIIR